MVQTQLDRKSKPQTGYLDRCRACRRACPSPIFAPDAPLSYTAQRYEESGDAGLIWEGHKASREIGYCHLEKLHNFEALPGDGFTVACFPVKIRGASAGWTRAVAIFDDD